MNSLPFVLREVTEEDIPRLHQALGDENITAYMGIRFTTTEWGKEQWDWYSEQTASGKGWYRAVCLPDNPTLIGVWSIYALNTQAGSAELGYWLFPEYWGQGLAKAICASFIPLVCRQFGLRQLTAIIEPENIASERLLLGLGFEFERLEKQAEQKNGRWIDLQHYKKIIPGSF